MIGPGLLSSRRILTVNVDRAGLFNGALDGHASAEVARTQRRLHRQGVLQVDRAQQVLVQIGLHVGIEF